jgi:hypothetical protein
MLDLVYALQKQVSDRAVKGLNLGWGLLRVIRLAFP